MARAGWIPGSGWDELSGLLPTPSPAPAVSPSASSAGAGPHGPVSLPGGRSHSDHTSSGMAAGSCFHCCDVTTLPAGAFTPRPRGTRRGPGWECAVVCPSPRHSKQTGDVKTQRLEKCEKMKTKRQSDCRAQRLNRGPTRLWQ